MSIKKKVSIKRAVQQALDDLGIEENTLVPVFKIWAADAENEIGSFTQYKKKNYVLDVCQCRATLPCEAKAVLATMLGDHGCDCDLKFNQVQLAINTSQLPFNLTYEFNIGGPACRRDLSWKIQNNELVFDENYHNQKVTVQLLIQEVDEEGWMLINENHVRAISSYIEYMYMKRSRHKIGGRNYGRNEIDGQFKIWSRLAAHCNADDGKPSPEEEAQMIAMWSDPLSGYANAFWLGNEPNYGIRAGV
jgi:hypothetical protein